MGNQLENASEENKKETKCGNFWNWSLKIRVSVFWHKFCTFIRCMVVQIGISLRSSKQFISSIGRRKTFILTLKNML